jgi:hypothetical protein
VLVRVTLTRRCCDRETILKLCQEERHPVQDLRQVVHEASLPSNQVQVAISHVTRQPGVHQSQHSGQDHFLEGRRQLFVLGHDRVVLPVTVLRIRRIRVFLGLLDPDPLVRSMDPDPNTDPSITKQK